MKSIISLILILALASMAHGYQYLTINGKDVGSTVLGIGDPVSIEICSTDSLFYLDWIGFEYYSLGDFELDEIKPEAGSYADAMYSEEYGSPGYYVLAFGFPSYPGVHFVFQYVPRECGITQICLLDYYGDDIDAVDIEIVGFCADADGDYAIGLGDEITLDGSSSRVCDDGDIDHYDWDIDNDGSYDIYSYHPQVQVSYDYLVNELDLSHGWHTIKLRIRGFIWIEQGPGPPIQEPFKDTDTAELYIFSTIRGDFDSSGQVDLFDFAILASQWLGEPNEPSADITPVGDGQVGDGIVDNFDLEVMASHWLQSTNP